MVTSNTKRPPHLRPGGIERVLAHLRQIAKDNVARVSPQKIVQATGLAIADVRAILVRLEEEKLIVHLSGSRYSVS